MSNFNLNHPVIMSISKDTVRTYLQEIGRIPLLTHEQEIIYGKRVQQMMKLLIIKEELKTELSQEPTPHEWGLKAQLTVTELHQILQQGTLAKKRMIEANLRLVVAIAKKYQKRHLEFLDLIQEGSLGLERAVEKFDPIRGYKFSTYAYWWIRQAITRAIAQQSRTIRLPIHITEKLNKIKRTQRELSQQLGRTPTPQEIGQILNLAPGQIREYLLMARHPISLDLKVGDNYDTELQELLEDERDCPEDLLSHHLLQEDLQTLMSELTPQQQEVIILRFGLNNGKGLSLSKIGERMNLSRERVRQLETQALNLMRRRRLEIRDYLVS